MAVSGWRRLLSFNRLGRGAGDEIGPAHGPALSRARWLRVVCYIVTAWGLAVGTAWSRSVKARRGEAGQGVITDHWSVAPGPPRPFKHGLTQAGSAHPSGILIPWINLDRLVYRAEKPGYPMLYDIIEYLCLYEDISRSHVIS